MLILLIVLVSSAKLNLLSHTNSWRLPDQAYFITLQINDQPMRLVLDIANQASWVYAKNPHTHEICSACPKTATQFDCKGSECSLGSTTQDANGNKFQIATNTIHFDNQTQLKAEISLLYEIQHQLPISVDGVLGSALLNLLLDKQERFSFMLYDKVPQFYLKALEMPSSSITRYDNLGESDWRLRAQVSRVGTQRALFTDTLVFDTMTKFIWLREAQITALISVFRDRDSLVCELDQGQLRCACPREDLVSKFSQFYMIFNNQNDFEIPLKFNVDFKQSEMSCNLNILKTNDLPRIGLSFIQSNQIIFDKRKKSIFMGEFADLAAGELHFEEESRMMWIALTSSLTFTGIVLLLCLLKAIKDEQLTVPNQKQPTRKLFVVPMDKSQVRFRAY